MDDQEQDLLDLYHQLSDQDAHSLIRYAQFLAGVESQQSSVGHGTDQSSADTQATEVSDSDDGRVPTPEPIERPDKERVVDALKRLSATYPMLDTKPLLDKASELVAQHVMFGNPAPDTINKIEAIFAEAYDKFVADSQRN